MITPPDARSTYSLHRSMAEIVAPFDELYQLRPFFDHERISAFAEANVLEVSCEQIFENPLHLSDGARSGEPR